MSGARLLTKSPPTDPDAKEPYRHIDFPKIGVSHFCKEAGVFKRNKTIKC
jgi:hypothetical protein